MFESFDTLKVKILSVNVIDRPGRISSDIKGESLPYTVLIGRGTGITRDYNIRRLPYLYIINKFGIIHTSTVYLDFNGIKKILDSLIESLEKKDDKEH